MKFIDEVKKVHEENYVAPLDMDAIVEAAYQRLLEEHFDEIKKLILEKVKQQAKEGIQNGHIHCSYEFKQSCRIPILGSYEIGKYKYGATVIEEESGAYVQFSDLYKFDDGEQMAAITSSYMEESVMGDAMRFFVSKTASFELTSFGSDFMWDLGRKCDSEKIKLEPTTCYASIDSSGELFQTDKKRIGKKTDYHGKITGIKVTREVYFRMQQ